MTEKLISLPQSETSKPIDYRDEINQILLDKNPAEKLHQTAQTVEHFLPTNTSLKLKSELSDPNKKDSTIYEFIYKCLPTLDNTVQKMTRLGIPDAEIVQFGISLLDERIRSWNPDKQLLKPYLGWKISKKFRQLICSQYQIPERLFQLIPIYFSSIKEFKSSYSRNPSPNDFSELQTIIQEKLEISLKKGVIPKKNKDSNTEGFNHLMTVIQDIHETNYSINQYRNQISPLSPEEKKLEQRLLWEKLDDFLGSIINPRYRKIIEYRFNLDDGGKRNQTEVGEFFHMSKQRVCQIEKKTLEKLTDPNLHTQLESFLY